MIICDGEGVENEVREAGSCLENLGLDDTPDGLSIWEGRAGCSNSTIGFDCDGAEGRGISFARLARDARRGRGARAGRRMIGRRHR